jgi:hypothetical protein
VPIDTVMSAPSNDPDAFSWPPRREDVAAVVSFCFAVAFLALGDPALSLGALIAGVFACVAPRTISFRLSAPGASLEGELAPSAATLDANFVVAASELPAQGAEPIEAREEQAQILRRTRPGAG